MTLRLNRRASIGGLGAITTTLLARSAVGFPLKKFVMHTDYDVLIVGGGPAGLSAALSLGRLQRSVLVCDDNRPRNLRSSHANNLPGHDGIAPEVWRKKVRQDLSKYNTVAFAGQHVSKLEKSGTLFRAEFGSGDIKTFRKVVLAYGIRDDLPDIPGLKEAWGRSVLHCPFCHGYEVRDKALGLIGNIDMFIHVAPVLKGLSEDLVLLTNGRSMTEEQRVAFDRNFSSVERVVSRLDQTDGQIEQIIFADGSSIQRDALFVAADLPLTTKSDLGSQLGCAKTDVGLYQIDEQGQTTIPGVYAAGDIIAFSSVLQSSAAGSMAGASLVFELAHEDLT